MDEHITQKLNHDEAQNLYRLTSRNKTSASINKQMNNKSLSLIKVQSLLWRINFVGVRSEGLETKSAYCSSKKPSFSFLHPCWALYSYLQVQLLGNPMALASIVTLHMLVFSYKDTDACVKVKHAFEKKNGMYL